jgi:hypothetical protein
LYSNLKALITKENSSKRGQFKDVFTVNKRGEFIHIKASF